MFYFYNSKTGEKYYSKQDLLWNKYSLSDLEINFGLGFDSIDWTKEPVESLKELRKQRAQQLRDTYSYLVLYYGGGSDSSTVLNSFLDNNIKLDEIVVVRSSDTDHPTVDGKYALYTLKKKNYSGKLTIVDIFYEKIKEYYSKQAWAAFRYNGTGNINVFFRTTLPVLEQLGFTPIIDRPSNIAHINGQSCPIINKIDNKYYLTFSSSVIGGSTLNTWCEPFYLTPNFPKLICKESHILVKYWKEHFPASKRILESDHVETGIFKKLIRDEWLPSLSPPKGLGDLNNMFNKDTEGGSILLNYTLKDNKEVLNLWKDSTAKVLINESRYASKGLKARLLQLNKKIYICDA